MFLGLLHIGYSIKNGQETTLLNRGGCINVRCRWEYQSKGPLAMELKVWVGNILKEVKDGVNLQTEL